VSDTELPSDAESVRAAFRLGWAVAELRGRYRPDLFLHPDAGAEAGFARTRDDRPLPLASERKNREIRIEIFQAAEGLSERLGLALQSGKVATLDRMRDVLALLENTNAATRLTRWPPTAEAFYKWDAQIQDALVVPAAQAAAYQLGRALAETYWALDPERPSHEMGSWACLFGTRREETIKRLLGRLSTYLDPLARAAVEGSFADWCKIAADEHRRSAHDVRAKLYRQGLLWRDLIRGERQALDLAPATHDAWKEMTVYRDVFATLRVPLLVGAGFAALLTGCAALLAAGASHPGALTAFSILGGLGATSAGMYARAKAQVTSLMESVRLAVDRHRVCQGANLCPLAPKTKTKTKRPAETQ
jgi:hypothetical protein